MSPAATAFTITPSSVVINTRLFAVFGILLIIGCTFANKFLGNFFKISAMPSSSICKSCSVKEPSVVNFFAIAIAGAVLEFFGFKNTSSPPYNFATVAGSNLSST